MEQILSNQEILAAATEYNKWLKELTPSEIDLIKSMLNEARSAGYQRVGIHVIKNLVFLSISHNGIGLNAVAILIDMAKWTWEALMRTETTLKTESLPLRFAHVISLAGEKLKLLREHTEATCASLLITFGAMFSVCLAEIVKPAEKVYWQTEIYHVLPPVIFEIFTLKLR